MTGNQKRSPTNLINNFTDKEINMTTPCLSQDNFLPITKVTYAKDNQETS